MADQNYIDRTAETKIVGQDSTGNSVNYVSADVNGNMLVKDYSDGPVTPGTAASASSLAGGQYNTSLPTLTTGQQSAVQLDSSGRLIIAPTTQGPLAEDHNYGTVGANTLRTASQIGNSTGGADFAAGNSSAQTLRVVVATNQSAIPVTGTFWQATQPISAVSLPLPTGAATEATLAKLPLAQASTTSGQYGILAQGAVTTAAPTYFNGATSPISLTTTGALRVDGSAVTQPVIGTLTNNNSSPLANNVGVLGAWAQNVVNPSRYTSNTQVLPIVDIAGNTNVDIQYFNSSAISASNPIISTLSDGVHTLNQAFSSYGTAPIGTYVQGVNAYITNAPEVSGIYNSTPPALTNGQTAPLQLTSSGALIVSGNFTAVNLSVSQIAVTSPSYATNVGGAVTTSAPTYVSGQLDALSLTTSGYLRVTDASDGPVTPGTVAINSSLIGGQYNSSLPTLTTGQQAAIQLDSSGRLIVSPTTQGPLTEDHNYGTVGANTLRTASQIGNATGSADFAAGNSSAQTLRVVIATNQSTLTVQDVADGSVAPGTAASFSMLIGGQFNTVLPTLTNTQQSAIQLDSSGRQIIAPLTNTSVVKAQLQDDAGNAIAAINSQVETRDVLNVSSQYRAQSVTTTAAEALGAATILANRKVIHITPTNGTIYWGYSNAVTTTTGTPLFPNNTLWLSVTDNIHVFVIAAATTDSRIGELS